VGAILAPDRPKRTQDGSNFEEIIVFFHVFAGPRPSKTAYGDPRSLRRGYLGLLGPILSHLGTILRTKAFKKRPSWFAGTRGRGFLGISGRILGPKIVLKIVISGVILLIILWTLFGPLLGPFWRPCPGRNGIKKFTCFLKALGGSLEPFWEVSWLSWGSLGRPGVPKTL